MGEINLLKIKFKQTFCQLFVFTWYSFKTLIQVNYDSCKLKCKYRSAFTDCPSPDDRLDHTSRPDLVGK